MSSLGVLRLSCVGLGAVDPSLGFRYVKASGENSTYIFCVVQNLNLFLVYLQESPPPDSEELFSHIYKKSYGSLVICGSSLTAFVYVVSHLDLTAEVLRLCELVYAVLYGIHRFWL